MYSIKTLNKISPVGLSLLNDQYELTEDTASATGILVRSQDMNTMDFSKNLLAIARAGAGVNNIPVDKCSENGIVVFNTPGANANAVKELVLAGLLLSSRDILQGCAWVKTLDTDIAKAVEKGKAQFAGNEIKGKTLGVLGLGAIGVMVANAATQLGMKVIGFDPYLSIKAALELSNKISVADNLEKLVPKCDFLSIHIPVLESTKGMINEELMVNMKDGVCILNFSRDSIVNDDHMAKALASGKVSRYVTDFPNEAVAHLDGVIAIPHLGASTEESEENCAVMAVEQLMDYIENGNIINSVNFPECTLGPNVGKGRIAIINKNTPTLLEQITSILASKNISVNNLINRSKGEMAYTLIDVDTQLDTSELEKAFDIEGIISVRVMK